MILNALCSEFRIAYLDLENEVVFSQFFQKGSIVDGNLSNQDIAASTVEIEFIPDEGIWELDKELNYDLYLEVIRELSYLFSGRTFEFKYQVGDSTHSAGFRFERGLADRISRDSTVRYCEPLLPLEFHGTSDEIDFDAASSFRYYDFESNFVDSFVNFERTRCHGTHVDAMIDGFISAISEVATSGFPEDKWEITREKILEVIAAAIHVRMARPSFEGSVKEQLDSKEVFEPIRNAAEAALTKAFENSEDEANRLLGEFRVCDDEWRARFLKEFYESS